MPYSTFHILSILPCCGSCLVFPGRSCNETDDLRCSRDTEDTRIDYTQSWANLMENLVLSEENILGYPLVERVPLAVVLNRDRLVADNYYRAESWYMSGIIPSMSVSQR